VKRLIVLTLIAVLIGVFSMSCSKGITRTFQVRPPLLELNPIHQAAYSAAKRVIDSINISTNTFNYPGEPYRIFDPQVIVTQPTLGNFRVTGMYYTPFYSMVQDSIGQILSIDGAYIFQVELNYLHSLDSLHFTPLWECESATVIPLSARKAKAVQKSSQIVLATGAKIGKNMNETIINIMALANEHWNKSLELKAQADSLRSLK